VSSVTKAIFRPAALACCAAFAAGIGDGAIAAPCLFEQIGEGRVAEVTDARSFRFAS
jgi:hypothetical protein